jgi:hypothetical protein
MKIVALQAVMFSVFVLKYLLIYTNGNYSKYS